MTNDEIDSALIRHINLSGDMYSRLVFGEENKEEKYLFQKHLYIENRPFVRWLEKVAKRDTNYINPSFRKLDKINLIYMS